MNMYFKMENPNGHRIEHLLICGHPIQGGRIHRAAMLGEQGVPNKYGSDRPSIDVDAIQASQPLFECTRPVRVNRRGSVVAI